MKKIIVLGAIVGALLTGCDETPTYSQLYTASQSVGLASGMIVNETKIDDASRNAVVDVIGLVAAVTPATNQTFATTWVPVAKSYTEDLVNAGKLDAGQAALVVGGVNVAAIGVDYLFEKYPKAKEYKELDAAVVKGFTEGFLAVVKPSDCDGCSERSVVNYDKKAYDYIKCKIGK